MTRCRYILFVLLLIQFASPAAHAWGREGHVIVARIALRRLTPHALEQVQRLIETEADPAHRTLDHAADWADMVLRPDHLEHEQYRHIRPYHYVNIPRNARTFDKRRDCRDGRCVVAAINLYRAVLRGGPAPRRRLMALKLLIHLIADVHQPLHVGYKDDRGGNKVEIDFFKEKSNLHEVWDTLLLRRDGATGNRVKSYADKLFERIQPRVASAWNVAGDPTAWVNETRLLLDSHVYGLLPSDQRLTDGYVRACIPVVQTQLQKAGVRLAALLNEVLAVAAVEACDCANDREGGGAEER
jgi:hypothetical protein